MIHRHPKVPDDRVKELLGVEALTPRQSQLLDVGQLLEQLDVSISRLIEAFAARHGLSRLESSALQVAAILEGEATLSAIGTHIGVSASTMTGIAARLESAGLARRERSSQDGRAWVMTLTADGHTRAKASFREFFGGVTEIANEWDNDTLSRLLDLIDLFNDAANDLADKVEAADRRR